MYTYKAVVFDVHDGDTFKAKIDLGFSVGVEETFRMLGINAPELKGETIEQAKKSRDFLRATILNKAVIIESSKPEKRITQEKYGRYLANVFLINEDQTTTSVNALMVRNGFAVPFMVE